MSGAIHASTSAGFSLVELLSAVAIMGVLAAIAIPSFSSFRRGGEATAAQADLSSCVMRITPRTAIDRGDASFRDTVEAAFADLCRFAEGERRVELSFEATDFWLSASTSSGTLRLSSSGRRQWDRNQDGDFDDPDEGHW